MQLEQLQHEEDGEPVRSRKKGCQREERGEEK